MPGSTMWQWEQAIGALSLADPDATRTVRIAFGYSGAGVAKNNPTCQQVHDFGPIPCGLYTIGVPFDSAEHGPFCLPLTPDPSNRMFGRAGFLIHGDSIKAPGTASKGCIILPRDVRNRIAIGSVHKLIVVPGLAKPATVS